MDINIWDTTSFLITLEVNMRRKQQISANVISQTSCTRNRHHISDYISFSVFNKNPLDFDYISISYTNEPENELFFSFL